jgi:ferric-dicitrate binding protein FerR (iron transport regulator)
MPSRKQRRRRQKTFRHEYETVLLDGEGNEIPLDPEELRAEREAKQRERAQTKPARGKQGKQTKKPARGSRAARPLREPPVPSWRRAFRRGGTMGALMLVAFLFILKSGPLPQRLAIGVFYGVAFIPLTFWIDRTAYRTYQRRLAKAAENPKT